MGATLEFKPDLEQATARWLAFWNKELIDRPCCVITAPKDPTKPMPPAPPYMAGAREEFGPIVRQVLERAAATWWGGEAIPNYTPSFGPDMFGAWLGGDLQFDKTSYGTNWVVPCVEDWSQSLPLRLDPKQLYHFEISAEWGWMDSSYYVFYGPQRAGGKAFAPYFGVSFKTLDEGDTPPPSL